MELVLLIVVVAASLALLGRSVIDYRHREMRRQAQLDSRCRQFILDFQRMHQ